MRIGFAVAAGVGVVAALGGVALAQRAGGDCAVEPLALPSPGAYTLVFAMDPGGRHIAGRTGGSGGADLDLVLWADGRPGVVDLPGENQVPNAVSATGVVVGSTVFGSLGGPQQLRAWIYRDGAVAILPGGESSEAFAVSDDGTAVGAVDGRPVLWRPSATGPAPLAGAGGKALGISADGSTVVGQVGAGGLMRPYVWSGAGAPRELPLPTIDGEPAVMASAQSVTGDWVAGMATSRDDDSGVPVRWNLRTGEVAAFPEHDLAGASSSIDGRITGQVGRRAMVLGGPEPLTLSPLDGKSGLRDSASGISLDGQVVAGNAGNAPVVWRCGATGPR